MSIFIKNICNFHVVSLSGFGISVNILKIYSGYEFLFRSMIYPQKKGNQEETKEFTTKGEQKLIEVRKQI